MNLLLKRVIAFIFFLLFFLFIGINITIYFYGPVIVSKLSNNTVTVEKIQYPFLPFFINVNEININTDGFSLDAGNSRVGLSSLYALFRGKHFLNITIKDTKAHILGSEDNSTTNVDYLSYLRLFNSISIYNSYVKYSGDFDIEVPIKVASISYDFEQFYFLLDDVLIRRADLVEKLKIALKGGIKRGNIFIDEGDIKGKYINLSIKNVEDSRDDKVIKAYFNGEILKIFDVLADGYISLDGHYKSKKLALNYKSQMNINQNSVVSEGTLISKKDSILLNADSLSFNDNNINIHSDFNYKKGSLKGNLVLLDYDILRESPINFIVNIKKKVFKVDSTIRSKEDYTVKGNGDFNNNRITLKKISLHSSSTDININSVISDKGIKGKIEGRIDNNEDVKELLKVGTHKININGSFDLERQQKEGSLTINFNKYPLYNNVESIDFKVSGKDTFQFLMSTIMREGSIKASGEFSDFKDWKIDYLVNNVAFKTSDEKKLGKPLQLDGYGIIQYANIIKSTGIIHIKGVTDDVINLTHNYSDSKLKVIIKNILMLQIAKNNKTAGSNYKLSIQGDTKEAPFNIQGIVGLENGRINYIFDTLSIKNILLSATGSVDINNAVLDVSIQSKSLTYPVKLDLKSDLTFKDDVINITGQLYSKEQYKLNCRLKKNNDKFFLDTFNVVSNSTTLSAYGDIKNRTFDINISGAINNNKDILSKSNIEHSINLKSNVEMNNNNIKYQSDIIFQKALFTFHNISSTGNFNVKSKDINVKAVVLSRHGSVNIKFNKQLEKPADFIVSTEKLKAGIIDEIMEIKSGKDGLISAYIKGEYSDKLKLNGNVDVKKLFFEKAGINFNFDGEIFAVENLTLENDIFHNPFSYSFVNKYLKIYIDKDQLKNKFINARNIYMDVEGPIYDLTIDSHFTVDNTAIGTINAKAKGNFSNLRLSVISDNLTVEGEYQKKGKYNGLINLSFSYMDLFAGELPLIVKKTKDSRLNVTSDKSAITLNKKYDILIEQLKFFIAKDGITHLQCSLRNDFFENIKLKDINIGLKGIYGHVMFNNGSIKYEDIFNLHTEGEMLVSYNYSDVPDLNGTVSGKGFLHYRDVSIKLPVKGFTLKAHKQQITLYALLYELESWLEVDYSADDYTNYLDSALSIKGEHIYVNKLGFSGIFDVNVQYNKNKRELVGDIFTAKSHYTFENFIQSSSETNKSINLPVSLNLNIKTIEPVVVESAFANANVNVNLKVLYQKELKLLGEITTTDTEVVIGREKFVIYENYIRFRGKIAPYLYLEARGTGEYSYVVLKIYGDLPNYKIDIMNLDPNSSTFYEAESGYNPQNLFTDVFAGFLLNDLLKVTENIIGINKIGFEQRAEGGQNVNYLKIGRQFSDRFEVKYIIGTQSQEEESDIMMVGEYILLDWFKFSLYSQNKGGSGVGFTFFNDF